MRHQFRYVALLDGRKNPFVVLRIRDSVEEIHVPDRGWESADPRWRDWFMNVPIEAGHALGLLSSLAPTELREDMDPYPHALSRDAAEGFGTQSFYYAVETAEHPLDDPLTLVKLHYPSKSEWWFTPDLVWAKAPVAGRRVRVSREDLDRLEEVLVRRAFGGAEVQHYAVVNPFYPDAEHPASIVRVGRDGEQRYVQDDDWVSTSVVPYVRHRHRHGTLIPLTDQAEIDRLVARWRPHPDSSRVRYFAWLTADEQPLAVMRAWDVDGGVEEESYVDGLWGGRERCVFDDEQRRVEIDQETAERLGDVLDQHDDGPAPEDGRYNYFAIVERQSDDVSTAGRLVRTWGGHDGIGYEDLFTPRIGRWRWCMVVYETRTGRDDDYAIPISDEVAEELRQILLAGFAARSAGRKPEVPRSLGKWMGFGKVTLRQIEGAVLDSLRQTGDPLADAAIAEVYELGAVDRVNEVLAGFVRNGDEVPQDLPPLVRRYFAESAGLPEWADRAVLARGQELWDRLGPHLATLLCCYLLPVRYGSAWALRHTRQGMESTRLLEDVLADGGLLDPGGRGLRTVQKIRLLHAAARQYVDPELLRANQEDLAATVGTLTVCLPQGLRRSWVLSPDSDFGDLFHIWSVVGHLMGVDPRLLPGNYDDAVNLMDTIWRRGRARTTIGWDLMAALEQRFRAALPGELGEMFSDLVRFYCDDGLANLLRVDPFDMTTSLGFVEPVTAAAGLPAGSIVDDRVWRRTRSTLVGEALLRADREDLALPPG
ncbi:oxygenase MpaB family protein [Lentzea sp. NPDC051213]|uniref:oxygenase MpaB family protein n=1 Tax=Lentzea sp. NPDC051213 TaxID=3364126 RepID=UPI0037959504